MCSLRVACLATSLETIRFRITYSIAGWALTRLPRTVVAVMDDTWTTGNDDNLQHKRLIAYGGFGEVHEVQSPG